MPTQLLEVRGTEALEVTSPEEAGGRSHETLQEVYRAAVDLSRRNGGRGYDAVQLADRLKCSVPSARHWMAWLQQTGDQP